MPLDIIRNDITRVTADAIVNTANPRVAIGPGTDRAVYEAAGREQLLAERAKIGEMRPGQAAYTPAFALPAKYIIHTVGPAWHGGSHHEREILAECYRRCLYLASELGCETVAFPLLSSGSYGFPKDEALKIAISEISSFLFGHDMTVLLVVYDKESFVVSGKAFTNVKSFIAENEVKAYPENRSQRREFFESEYRAYRPESVFPDEIGSALPCSAPEPEEARPESRARKSTGRGKRSSGLRDIFRRKDTGAFPKVGEALREHDEDFSEDLDYESSVEMPAPEDALFEGSVLGSDALSEQSKETVFDADSDAHPAPYASYKPISIDDIIKMKGDTFQQVLFKIIDRKGLTDPEVYKKANIDRKLFSKIRSNVDYTPSKTTVLALIIGLELNIDEATDLLQRAGYSFSPGSVSDLTVQSCITQHMYDIHTINCYLFELGQKTLV